MRKLIILYGHPMTQPSRGLLRQAPHPLRERTYARSHWGRERPCGGNARRRTSSLLPGLPAHLPQHGRPVLRYSPQEGKAVIADLDNFATGGAKRLIADD